jgi:hypothetical protein
MCSDSLHLLHACKQPQLSSVRCSAQLSAVPGQYGKLAPGKRQAQPRQDGMPSFFGCTSQRAWHMVLTGSPTCRLRCDAHSSREQLRQQLGHFPDVCRRRRCRAHAGAAGALVARRARRVSAAAKSARQFMRTKHCCATGAADTFITSLPALFASSAPLRQLQPALDRSTASRGFASAAAAAMASWTMPSLSSITHGTSCRWCCRGTTCWRHCWTSTQRLI